VTELRSSIVKELQKSETILKTAGFLGDEAGLVILHLLRLMNSGSMRGVYTVRLNGHHIGDPKLQDVKESLSDLRETLTLSDTP